MAFLVILSAFLFFQAASASVTSDLTAAWSLIDEGEVVPYALLMKNAIINSAHGADGEAYAVGASFLAISELSWVRPSSGCGYSNLIAASLGHGKKCHAIDGFAVALAQAVENFRILGYCCVLPSPWPSMDNSCGDYGRAYDFENAWSSSPVGSNGLSTAARDLYRSFTSAPNNVGAAVTSAATDEAMSILKVVKNDILDYMRLASSSNSNCKSKHAQLRRKAGALKAKIFNAADAAK
nr:fibroin light chain [Plectrocnemia conspersa]